MRQSTTKPVILDVDTGVDDALALMLAVAHPRLDLRAVTCVGGNVPLDQVVENTLGILKLMGADAVPVAAGMSAPLLEPPQHADDFHGRNGIADVVLAPHGLEPTREHAVELLRRTIEHSGEPLTLVTLAPMTNIAVLLRMYPEVLRNVERIVCMGGAIGLGNATAAAEFNIFHDPEAAEVVFRSGVPITMYGLEPFYRVAVDESTITRLIDSHAPVAQVAGRLLQHSARMGGDDERIPAEAAACIGDAGAVCAVIDPDALVTRAAPVQVVLDGTVARGQTLVDFRTGPEPERPVGIQRGLVDVVFDVDGARYRRLFLETLVAGWDQATGSVPSTGSGTGRE
ncbi:nucleoside hydrolase [Lysobacter korlensis]|uniref:Nucleoside hydrolase n=1 Tax=Lysobacter korlensis TaxID=553636 RepID=A0ABV6S073_9GAMM